MVFLGPLVQVLVRGRSSVAEAWFQGERKQDEIVTINPPERGKIVELRGQNRATVQLENGEVVRTYDYLCDEVKAG